MMDPMRLWLDWLESGARAAPGAAPGEPGAHDPWSLYLQGVRSALDAMTPMAGAPVAGAAGKPPGMTNPFDLWQRWLEALPMLALNPGVFAAAQSASDPFGLTARWREMVAAWGVAMRGPDATAGAAPGATPETPPGDPWTLLRQWYETASAGWSQELERALGSAAFAQASGRFLEASATATRAARRAAEEQLKALQMPSRADIARVAGLVVQLEAKVDRIEEALEDADDRAATLARADAIAALEARISRIEAKLDRLLAAMGTSEPDVRDQPANAPPTSGNGATGRAHKPSTTRTRRKPPSA